MRTLALVSLALTLLAGCPAAAPACPPDGTGFSDGTGLYCAYGVVVGGFRNCPSDLPNRFDFDDGSFVCSDHPIGSRERIPMRVCDALPACRTSSSMDAGMSTDAALPPGPFACGASSCSGGQICLETRSLTSPTPPDMGTSFGDAGFVGACMTRPPECGSQGDCVLSSCVAACVAAVCHEIPGYRTATLVVSDGGLNYLCEVSADAA